jgi:hypothetical protein
MGSPKIADGGEASADGRRIMRQAEFAKHAKLGVYEKD